MKKLTPLLNENTARRMMKLAKLNEGVANKFFEGLEEEETLEEEELEEDAIEEMADVMSSVAYDRDEEDEEMGLDPAPEDPGAELEPEPEGELDAPEEPGLEGGLGDPETVRAVVQAMLQGVQEMVPDLDFTVTSEPDEGEPALDEPALDEPEADLGELPPEEEEGPSVELEEEGELYESLVDKLTKRVAERLLEKK